MLGSIDEQKAPRYDASRWAAAVLAVVLIGIAFVIGWVVSGQPTPPIGQPAWLEPIVTMVSFGVAGAVLVDRRPDLPFGWLLAGAAVLVVIQVAAGWPAYRAAIAGDHGPLTRWGLTAATLGFVPIAVQGLINNRFPAGRPTGRFGPVLDKALLLGGGLVLLGGFLGASGGSSMAAGDPN